MKKIVLTMFAILAVSSFAAETNNVNNIGNENVLVQATQGISKSDSFMMAFGMDTETRIGDARVEGSSSSSSSGTESGSTTSTSGSGTGAGTVVSSGAGAAVSVGVATAAINAITSTANNSVTIVTPYGKY